MILSINLKDVVSGRRPFFSFTGLSSLQEEEIQIFPAHSVGLATLQLQFAVASGLPANSSGPPCAPQGSSQIKPARRRHSACR